MQMKQCSQLNYASKIPSCNIKSREIGLYDITTGRILYPGLLVLMWGK